MSDLPPDYEELPGGKASSPPGQFGGTLPPPGGMPPSGGPPPYSDSHYGGLPPGLGGQPGPIYGGGTQWGPQAASPFGAPYATWGKRVAAYIIDILIILVAEIVLLMAGREVGILLDLVGSFAYFTVLIGGQRGQTVGMMALRITVRDKSTGQPIGYGRGLLRYLIMVVLGWIFLIPLVIDCLWPLWDANRQAWHDMATSSVVIDAL